MHEEIIANMRARISRVRHITNWPTIQRCEALQMTVVQAEADIAKLEAEDAESGATRH